MLFSAFAKPAIQRIKQILESNSIDATEATEMLTLGSGPAALEIASEYTLSVHHRLKAKVIPQILGLIYVSGVLYNVVEQHLHPLLQLGPVDGMLASHKLMMMMMMMRNER